MDVYLRAPDVRPSPPSEHRPEVPRALDDVLMRALSHDPGGRFDSATDYADGLESALTAPETYRAVSRRPKSRVPSRRARTARWVALVSSSIVLFVVGLFLGFTMMRGGSL